MKKFAAFSLLSLLPLWLTGCSTIGEKHVNFSPIYGVVTALSLLLLIVCCRTVRKNRVWLVVLFISVLVVNIGYTVLSLSTSLEMALMANRLAYLGSVFLPLSMLLIILQVTHTPYGRRLPCVLLGIAIVIFLIAASPGILDIYYKEVSFAVVNGVSTLVKVYGPLHPLYMVYLLGYFAAMVAVITRAAVKKSLDSTIHAVILAMAVLVNIGVWFIEQLFYIEFEMLSLSYIISELFLLGVHLAMSENQRLKEIVKQAEAVQNFSESDKTNADIMLERPLEAEQIPSDRINLFIRGLSQLTPTEKIIYDAYIARVTTKEIMANLDIKENTLKYHNKNLYGKLGVSSRKELLEMYKYLKVAKEKYSDQTF